MDLTTIAWMAGLFAVSFLLGSIPSGVIISRVFFHKDIRNEGSGNIGTTNAMRSMGKVGGSAVFVMDFGKGIISGLLALLLSNMLSADPTSGIANPDAFALCEALAFGGAVWGHIFSPWLGFKGGKGIATAIGVLWFAFGPLGFVLEIAIFAVLVVATRYVSVGSIASAAACPFFSLWFLWGHWAAVAIMSAAALTIVWAHRGNISRLMSGTENRIGSKKKGA